MGDPLNRKRPGARKGRLLIPLPLRQQCRDLYHSGVPIHQIAAQLGLNPKSVSKFVRRMKNKFAAAERDGILTGAQKIREVTEENVILAGRLVNRRLKQVLRDTKTIESLSI